MNAPRYSKDEVRSFSLLREILDKHFLDSLARGCGFVERKRKLLAEHFVDLCVFPSGGPGFASLEQSLGHLQSRFGLKMAKSSLNDRFNSAAVAMMGMLVRLAFLERLAGRVSDALTGFSEVLVLDSTISELLAKCAGRFPGFGGGASDASVKVQYMFDLQRGSMRHLEVQAGRATDNGFRFGHVVRNALYLFDLGYVVIENLRRIQSEGAWFLCRHRFGTQVYVQTPDGVKGLDLLKVAGRLMPGEHFDCWVLLGKKDRLPVRLLLTKLSEEVGNSIRRRLKTDKQGNRRKVSAERLAFCDVNAYTTNLHSGRLPVATARKLYSLRWQVEIVFKAWKSSFRIDHTHDAKPERVECLLYGTLVRIILCTRIFWFLKMSHFRREGKELSELKSFQYLSQISTQIRDCFVVRKTSIEGLLHGIDEVLAHSCVKDCKKGDLFPTEILAMFA